MSLIEVLCWLREELPLTRRQEPKVGRVFITGELAFGGKGLGCDLMILTCATHGPRPNGKDHGEGVSNSNLR